MEQSGNQLTLKGDPVYKGKATHNGILQKLHDNAFTTGFSTWTQATGVNPRMGFGGWLDPATKDNVIRFVKPTNGIFAGILARCAWISSGQPAAPAELIAPYSKGLMVQEGYVNYKTGFSAATADENQAYADVTVGMKLFINDANGRQRFAAEGATVAGFTEVNGKIVRLNPDDKSWTVKIYA